MINFQVLVIYKIEFEHLVVLYVPVGTRFRSVTSGTQLYIKGLKWEGSEKIDNAIRGWQAKKKEMIAVYKHKQNIKG